MTIQEQATGLSTIKKWKFSLLSDAELQAIQANSTALGEREWIATELARRKSTGAEVAAVSPLPTSDLLDRPAVEEPWEPKFALSFAKFTLFHSALASVIFLLIGLPMAGVGAMAVAGWSIFVKSTLADRRKEGAVMLIVGSVCLCGVGFWIFQMIEAAPHMAKAARGLMWVAFVAGWSVLASISVLPGFLKRGRLE